MNKRTKLFFTALMSIVLTATFAAPSFSQRGPGIATPPVAPVYPQDFSNAYYTANSVSPVAIKGRLTGKDFLSVFEKTNHPNYSNVRALITLPAYSGYGDHLFFTPFGVVTYPAGIKDGAYALASRHPMYLFPAPSVTMTNSPYGSMRQAVLFDDNSRGLAEEANPIGLRLIIRVKFIAPTTAEQMVEMNGKGGDGYPIVKTTGDLSTLIIYGLVSLSNDGDTQEVAISPAMTDTKAFAKDAFLSTVLFQGKPLPAEMEFVTKFDCFSKGFCG
jgi:hypothetical protein